MQLLVYPVTFFVWFTQSVNHAMSWSKILIPRWIYHGEQSACHVVYYRRRWVLVYAQLSYLSFKASESIHFAMVAVTHCQRSFFLSSFSFIFFCLDFGLSSKCRLQRGVVLSPANISWSGPLVQVTPHWNLGVIIDSLCGHISWKSFTRTFFILNICLYHMLSKKIT